MNPSSANTYLNEPFKLHSKNNNHNDQPCSGNYSSFLNPYIFLLASAYPKILETIDVDHEGSDASIDRNKRNN